MGGEKSRQFSVHIYVGILVSGIGGVLTRPNENAKGQGPTSVWEIRQLGVFWQRQKLVAKWKVSILSLLTHTQTHKHTHAHEHSYSKLRGNSLLDASKSCFQWRGVQLLFISLYIREVEENLDYVVFFSSYPCTPLSVIVINDEVRKNVLLGYNNFEIIFHHIYILLVCICSRPSFRFETS